MVLGKKKEQRGGNIPILILNKNLFQAKEKNTGLELIQEKVVLK